ncbi:MAG TPA: asparagine synthase (glutamine-hydrolyzing) [Candidatus Ozemobacteraceae bacterium]|nr:asparagine synthase (glutamine-hydrolyzing) [Candidatus Ozemobacteraceae bacterium]
MCGIVGCLSFNDSAFRITPERLDAMRDTMVHRGPDGGATWIGPDGRIGLAHRRLSIIDLSATADQPMHLASEGLHIIFNGEIYNHADIRRELTERGRTRWQTDHSDTEMVLQAWAEWGPECLHRFRGMFAIALWDDRKRELWLIRDRIGIKPLYYSFHHGRLTFGSEIKALLADPEQPRAVDEEALYHYLSFLTTPAPMTLFAGIRKLPGGCLMRVRPDGTHEEHRWYEIWDHTKPLTGLSDDEIARRILEELRTSVRLRKVSDVPVGVFLSGGIDSSTNTALFSEGEQSRVKTFTIGYKGEYKTYRNETHYARRMAELAGTDHHERLLDVDDLISFLPRMVELQDEPIADPVCVPVYYVSELARRNGVIVCQVGEGADELFWGYPRWKAMLQLQKLAGPGLPRFLPALGRTAMSLIGQGDSLPAELLRRAAEGVPLFWGGAEAFTEAEKRRILSPRLREKFRGFTSWNALQPIRADFEAKAWDTSPLSWMSYLDLRLRLPELLLMRVDKMSMGVSLEGRVPFLDHKFVELAMSIPPDVKTRGGTLKHILKKAVRGVIPDELIDRQKQGFNVPVHEWFFDRLGEKARADVADVCRQTDLLDPAAADAYLRPGRGKQGWYLLNFALWWKHWFGR